MENNVSEKGGISGHKVAGKCEILTLNDPRHKKGSYGLETASTIRDCA